MNIGIVTTWFDRGAAYVSRQYADVLSQEHDVFIFARGGEQYAENNERWENDYEVFWAKRYEDTWSKICWPEFKSWVNENNISVVLFNEQKDWEIIVDAKKLNIKTVAYVDYYTRETVPFFWLYDAVICNTKRHFSVFEKHHGSVYIPWGTDTEVFNVSHEKEVKKDTDDVVFFHSAGLGGINMRKGTDFLVRAFNRLDGNAKLIIHSQAPENN